MGILDSMTQQSQPQTTEQKCGRKSTGFTTTGKYGADVSNVDAKFH